MFQHLQGIVSESFRSSFNESDRNHISYGIISFIGIFSFYFVNLFVSTNEVYESPALRLTAAIITIPLILKNQWPEQLKRFFPAYWYLSLAYTLPFFFTYMLLNNPDTSLWHVNGLISLVVLGLFMSWIPFSIILACGAVAGLLLYGLTKPLGFPLIPAQLIGIVLNYGAPIFYIMFFINRKEVAQLKERVEAMKMLAGSIAHELRTPLTAISLAANNITRELPFYRNASSDVHDEKTIAYAKEVLLNAPELIQSAAHKSNVVINMLLANLKEGKNHPKEECSMSACLAEALSTYPLQHITTPIHWDSKQDFRFYGNPELMKHVFYNLLKNALNAIDWNEKKGEIFIELVPGEKIHTVLFKDTAKGISPKNLPRIFDRFYTKNTCQGTGIGLAFCRSVIRDFGGDISCESVENEYTLFTLHLPALQKI